MSTAPQADPRVMAGMKAQLSARARQLAAGGKRLGWKAGFGAPSALEKFSLAGPLMGWMLQDARVISGDTVSISGWKKPVAEPEIAIHIGLDLPDGRDRAAVQRAVSGIGPAIELADLDPPPEDVTMILSGNIFHRRVILGRCDTSRVGARLDGVVGRLKRNGTAADPVTALEANTGRLLDVLAHMADTLAACGESILAGDVIICGSVVPPLFLDATDAEITFALAPIGEISVRLSHD